MFRRLYLLVTGLALISLGCGLITPEATPSPAPTATETPAPTRTPPPTEEVNSAEEIIPFPTMDDAADAEDFFGLYSYVTAYSVQEIVEFYQEELTAMGMTLSSETVGSDFAVLQFDRTEDHPVTLNVITNDAGLREVRLAD